MPGQSLHVSYMGDDPIYAGGLLYKMDLAIIVGTLSVSGVPGSMHVWNGKVFKQHASWMAAEDPAIERLLFALARADLAEGFPKKLLFIWIEPKDTSGYSIAKPVRGAISLAVCRIRKELMALGVQEVEKRQGMVSVNSAVAYMDV